MRRSCSNQLGHAGQSTFVAGVFSLAIQDKYRKGPDGCTHVAVISLREPVIIGKSPHSTIAFAENGGKLVKAGPVSVELRRTPQRDLLRDPDQLPLPAATEGASAAAAALAFADQFDALRRLLSAACGRIGGSDPAVFRSAGGLDCIKAYSKTSDGFLFPLRRCGRGGGRLRGLLGSRVLSLLPRCRALLFGLRPLVAIPHSAIASVRVGRGGGSGASRTFDLDVTTVDGKTTQFRSVTHACLFGPGVHVLRVRGGERCVN